MTAAGDYDEVISLGCACQPAAQLKRLGLRHRAHMFDWLITDDRALLTGIATGLQGWFALPELTRRPDGVVVHRTTGARFLHEFPQGGDLARDHAAHADRMAVLQGRWQRLMEGGRSVLFVRQAGWGADRPAQARAIAAALAQAAPRLQFRLLFLIEPRDWQPDWVHGPAGAHVLFDVLNRQDEPDWRGHPAEWDRVLAGVRLRPVRPSAPPTSPETPAAPDSPPARS
jgi:hypothetical protein